MQAAKIRGAVISQRVSLEPCPRIFDRIQVRRIRRQKRQLDMAFQPIQILAHQFAAVRSQPIQDNQQWVLDMGLERLQEFDNLSLLDTSLVQAEQAVGAGQP